MLEPAAQRLTQDQIVALLASHQTLQASNQELRERIGRLEHQLEWFKKQLFGSKSERRLIEPAPNQMSLGAQLERAAAAAALATRQMAAHTRRVPLTPARDETDEREGLKFDETVPVEVIEVADPELDALSAGQYEVIGEKETYRLAQRPGSYVVALGKLISDYLMTQALHAAAKLGVADQLVSGPRHAAELSRALGVKKERLCRLLRALLSVEVFREEAPEVFSLTPLGELLASDAPGSMRDYVIALVEENYQAAAGLYDSLYSDQSAYQAMHRVPFFEHLRLSPAAAARFDRAMSQVSREQVRALLEAFDFSSHTPLVDVGGGDGTLLRMVLAAHPDLTGTLFDLPHVVERAAAGLTGVGLEGRCEVVGGSFFESVPAGGQSYLLKYILHDWDDEHALGILRNVRQAMPDSGRLLVVERIYDPWNDPASARGDLLMHIKYGAKERSEVEFRGLLSAAGFELLRVVPTRLLSILEARPTAASSPP